MVEIGNVSTDWVPAEEDFRHELATYVRNAEEDSAELSRRIETADGKAVDAKTYAQQTAEGFKSRIESLETFKDDEDNRASRYFSASRDETARQLTAMRTEVTEGFVAKSTFEENARGVTQRFESLQVGGRNYFSGYQFNQEIPLGNYQGTGSFSQLYNKLTYPLREANGKTFTISLEAISPNGNTPISIYNTNGNPMYFNFNGGELGTVGPTWKRFSTTVTVVNKDVSNQINPNRIEIYARDKTGVKVRNIKVELGNMVTDWSPAPEDQQSYADTKIAEYKTTVDGRFATLQSQKANQVDLQIVRETVNLYERIIGSTETGIKDKVARMVMTDSLFLTEVKDKISGTATQVSQLNNSYAIKNLTSAGTVLNQINLLANGTNRIDGRLTHITGQTLIDNGVIKNAMIGELDAGKITSGTVDAARIKANSIDGSKIAFDEAFFNGLSANQAYLKKLFAKDAFLTAVQAVTLSASKISGGILTATNGAMKVNLNAGQILYYTDQAALKRVLNGYPTQFVKFATGTVTGKGNAGVTAIGSNRWNSESSNDGGFVGIRAWNGANIDQIDVVGDTVRLASSAFEAADGWNINTLPGKLDIDAFNADHRASSKIKVGDLWLWKNATTYSSMRDTINLIIDNLQLLHNNKSTERGYSYTLPAKV
ncbi:TPA: hypothetical protein U1C92_000466 [Streptococcus suis]|nr:hypothetical protein [Streptococcus suis]HEM3685273.1 hypothetical protein [Streptococcus suis]HEM3692828.1 hypothetical protein [Streptococcus suis]